MLRDTTQKTVSRIMRENNLRSKVRSPRNSRQSSSYGGSDCFSMVLNQDAITSVIFEAKRLDQLQNNLAASGIVLVKSE